MSRDSIRSNWLLALGCLAGSLLTATDKPACGQTKDGLSTAETRMVRSVDAHAEADLELLKKLVDLNSGTMHLAGVEAVKDIIMPQFASLGFKVRWVPMQSQTARAGDLIAEHPCPAGEGQCGQKLLLIGHMDTVFEPSSSFQHYAIVLNTDGKIATGPGVARSLKAAVNSIPATMAGCPTSRF